MEKRGENMEEAHQIPIHRFGGIVPIPVGAVGHTTTGDVGRAIIMVVTTPGTRIRTAIDETLVNIAIDGTKGSTTSIVPVEEEEQIRVPYALKSGPPGSDQRSYYPDEPPSRRRSLTPPNRRGECQEESSAYPPRLRKGDSLSSNDPGRTNESQNSATRDDAGYRGGEREVRQKTEPGEKVGGPRRFEKAEPAGRDEGKEGVQSAKSAERHTEGNVGRQIVEPAEQTEERIQGGQKAAPSVGAAPHGVPDQGDIQDVEMEDGTKGESSKPTLEWERDKMESRVAALKSSLTEKEKALEALQREREQDGVKMKDAQQTWERQKAEMEATMKTLEASLAEQGSIVESLRSQKEAEGVARANDAVQKRDHERTQMEGRIRSLESTLAQRQAALESLERQYHNTEKSAWEWQEQFRAEKKEHEETRQSMSGKLKGLKQKITTMQRELEQTKDLLNLRTEENKAVHAFMTTAGQYSLADLKGLLEQLNDEIFQCAVDMSDAVLEQVSSPPTFDGDKNAAWLQRSEEASQAMSKMYTPELVSRLRAEIAKEETILFEGLVQNILVGGCEEFIKSFSEDAEFNNGMKQVWKHIVHSQPTSVAKGWLAITHSKLKERPINQTRVLDRFENAMCTAGWRPVKGSERSTATFESAVKEKVTGILEKAARIKEVMWEGILSEHLDVMTVGKGRPFTVATMQDAYGVPGSVQSPDQGEGESVVCTTALGLVCRTRKPISPGSEKMEWKLDMILKPKVLLESTLSS
ncbi:hypothetical protein NMY22_g14892 [Coprinellus aureogranulatus]|nr:hypothetical protein NMY22_g14892 [Coprinellus aureogranulatus]